MSTRIYLPSSGLPAISPAFAAWTVTSNTDRMMATLTKLSSPFLSKIGAAPGANNSTCARQYVFGPIAAQTFGGTLKGQIRATRSTSGSPLCALYASVVKPDGTLRGVLVPITTDPTAVTTTTLTNHNILLSTSVSAVTAVSGDYIVLEYGSMADATNRAVSFSFGDSAATDLPEDTTTTTALNPWLEFSQTIKLPISTVTGVSSTTGVRTITF